MSIDPSVMTTGSELSYASHGRYPLSDIGALWSSLSACGIVVQTIHRHQIFDNFPSRKYLYCMRKCVASSHDKSPPSVSFGQDQTRPGIFGQDVESAQP
jgi:hypothetical protein